MSSARALINRRGPHAGRLCGSGGLGGVDSLVHVFVKGLGKLVSQAVAAGAQATMLGLVNFLAKPLLQGL